MNRYNVSYTKVFIPGSSLEGIRYPETESGLTIEQAEQRRVWAQIHQSKPVRAYCSSHYTIADFTVEPAN